MKNSALSCLLALHLGLQANQSTHLEENLTKENIQFVELLFTDPVNATLKEIIIPVKEFRSALKNGLSFDSSSIPGFGNAKGKDQITASDMIIKIDPSSYAPVMWNSEQTARFMCTVYVNEHDPYTGDPRTILQSTLNEAREKGYDFFVGPEIEFFITKQIEPESTSIHNVIDRNGYFAAQTTFFLRQFKQEALATLQAQGIEVEKWHHEVAPGQHEISIKYGNALKVADQVILTKHILKTIAQNRGLHISFMPKPLFGQNGSGMHLNVSLANLKDGSNAFHDQADEHNLSVVAKQFIAGLLSRLQELTLIFNPSVNSFKRLVPGYEAPRTICWGSTNRSDAIRIPLNRGNAQATRAELRSPDTLCNPYLAFAAILKAGLEGINNQAVLDAPVDENVFHLSDKEIAMRGIKTLPTTLGQAIDLFEQSTFAHLLCGDPLFEQIIRAKRKEARAFDTFVTDWETEHYF